MTDLSEKKCIPCEGGIPSFDLNEIHKYLKKVDGWDVKSENNESYFLIKEFKFNDFLESQSFINICCNKKTPNYNVFLQAGIAQW